MYKMSKSVGKKMSELKTKSIYEFLGIWLLAALILGSARVAIAQNGPSSPVAGPVQPTYQLHVNVRRIFVDVVVTDHKGQPVKGLKSGDFQVYEDGVLQPKRGRRRISRSR
jgi:hypothetical protein